MTDYSITDYKKWSQRNLATKKKKKFVRVEYKVRSIWHSGRCSDNDSEVLMSEKKTEIIYYSLSDDDSNDDYIDKKKYEKKNETIEGLVGCTGCCQSVGNYKTFKLKKLKIVRRDENGWTESDWSDGSD